MTTQLFEPGCGYELNPAVALRPEPFGVRGLPRTGTDHSRRPREVALDMPSMRSPAKLCDLSPLAGMS